jgi:uncharacterized membrane protein
MYEFVSALHISSAVVALLCGSAVVALQKGTLRHRRIGYCYVAAMILLNASALSIYRLTGSFGPFHYGALFSLLTVVAGFVPAYLRRPGGWWLELHYRFMSWSFVGLLAAGASEAAARLPAMPFWPAVVASSLLVFLLGGMVIGRRRPAILRDVDSQRAAPDGAAESRSCA